MVEALVIYGALFMAAGAGFALGWVISGGKASSDNLRAGSNPPWPAGMIKPPPPPNPPPCK